MRVPQKATLPMLSCVMKPDEKREAFRQFMKINGLTAFKWSKLTEKSERPVAESTIRAYLNKKTPTRSFTGDTEQRLADAIGVSVQEMYTSPDFSLSKRHPMVRSNGGAGPANENKSKDGAMDYETLVRMLLRVDVETRLDALNEAAKREKAATREGRQNQNP